MTIFYGSGSLKPTQATLCKQYIGFAVQLNAHMTIEEEQLPALYNALLYGDDPRAVGTTRFSP